MIRSRGQTILFDPVLVDPFEDGAVVSHPPREVDDSSLRNIDAVVITHGHPDHFDLHSLHKLRRGVKVIVPKDSLITNALKGLGFDNQIVVDNWSSLSVGDVELIPTPSLFTDCVEHGYLIRSQGVCVWNQADSLVNLDVIDMLIRSFGPIDVHLAWYACQNFEFFENRSTIFPAKAHTENLVYAASAGARVTIPASNGFRFAQPHDWLNPFIFPVSEERFRRDLILAFPSTKVESMSPGDVLIVDREKWQKDSCASPYAHALVPEAPLATRFDLSQPIPPLRDPGIRSYSVEELRERLSELLECIEQLGQSSKILKSLFDARIGYRLAFIMPDGSEITRIYMFSPDGVSRGKPNDDWQMSLSLAASVACAFLDGKATWFLLRAYRRVTNTAMSFAWKNDSLCASPVQFVDLLSAIGANAQHSR